MVGSERRGHINTGVRASVRPIQCEHDEPKRGRLAAGEEQQQLR